jgi:hypothetical protein
MNTTDAASISLILYAFQFSPMRDIPEWQEVHTQHFLKYYGKDKLSYIKENIDNYFLAKDLDLNAIIPYMNASIEEKESLLEYIRKNLIENVLKNY